LIFGIDDRHLFLMDSTADKVHAFIMEHSSPGEKARSFSSDPFWKGLRDTGTEPWLDTGDIEAAAKLWSREFTALTTNNTLLNKEVQKGIYDSVIREAGPLLRGMGEAERVVEIAFILNALHGLRLAQTFGARVSVELHTATADDSDVAVAYGRRFHRVSPDRFIVKVPLTAAGFVATRKLRAEGIPVNFTLGFSARQNFLVTGFAGPSYVNVFLGRLNAYVSDNGLGDGLMVGEKAALASQAGVKELSRKAKSPTLQIAASMRGGSQVRDLAGMDVMTIPVATAAEARSSLDGKWKSRLSENYTVKLAPDADARAVRLSVLWDITAAERALCESLAARPPSSAADLANRARESGLRDIFPALSAADSAQIAADGKIPRHARWADRIAKGELAIDTLLTRAGLASFAADQKELDDRIRRLIV
jgi:transaldolase